MSLHLEMVQVARLARGPLGDAAMLVHDFLFSRLNADGGFQDRSGQSDLYYTVFGLEGMMALQADVPCGRVTQFLGSFQEADRLDFVHQCCLARAWGAIRVLAPKLIPPSWREGARDLALGIESHRSRDGGYHLRRGREYGTAYGCFLALGAYQELEADMPEPKRLAESLDGLRTPDHGWGNERGLAVGGTNATAAAMVALRQLGREIPEASVRWMLDRRHAQGGFVAAPGTAMPDLLSTATALHALAGVPVNLGDFREAHLDFVDSLWTNQGGFHGHWADDQLDVEYTYYGLLALGHLAAR